MLSNINILLVDDHSIVRKGIEIILNANYPKAVIYNAQNYEEAIQIIKLVKIDLIVLDIIIKGVENIKIMKELKGIQSSTKILVFSCHEEEQYGMRYVKNGADGYLNKSCSENDIINAFCEIIVKGNFYSDETGVKLKKVSKRGLCDNPIDSLSNREFEITKMLINGSGNLEIANKLNIRMSTVSTYKTRVFEKLNVNNVVALSELFKS